MEISSEEGEIPMPINSVYNGVVLHGHGHAHQGHMMTHQHQHAHHVHEPPSSTTSHDHNMQRPTNNSSILNGSNNTISNVNGALNLEDKQQEVPYNAGSDKDCNNDDDDNPDCLSNVGLCSTTKKLIKFKECLKNHAASMGGNATDGCGEFMPSGEEGSLEALTCSVCNCHRNFHRKEVVGENQKHYPLHSPRFYLSTPRHQHHHILSTGVKKVILGSGGGSPGARGGQGYLGHPGVGARTLVPVSRAIPISVPYQAGPSATPSDHSDDHDHSHDHQCAGGTNGSGLMLRQSHNYRSVKKRFRTKFSQEQKQKMLEFANKVGWKIQRVEDSIVQQFCQEIGVKRRVLKVWMHNNKLTLAKKNHPNSTHNEDTNNNNINSSLV